jgi:hypothetical protein
VTLLLRVRTLLLTLSVSGCLVEAEVVAETLEIRAI